MDPYPFSVLLFMLLGVVMWLALCFFTSLMGWRRLASAFTNRNLPEGDNYGLVSAEIGGQFYGKCLIAVVASQGLWLTVFPPYFAFHPPLLLPWNKMSIVRETKVLWIKKLTLNIQLSDGRPIKTVLRGSLADAARGQVEKSHPQTV